MDPYTAREEIDRLGLEAMRLSASGGHGSVTSMAGRLNRAAVGAPVGQRLEYDHSSLSAPDSGLPGISLADVDQAAAELSQKTGIAFDVIMAAARARAAGRDAQELAVALAAEANDLLSLGGGYGAGYGDGTIALASSISDVERREAASKGHALPDGSYPIRNKHELHAAAVLAASGHGDVAAAKRLIRKRAGELGVDVTTLPGFGDDDDHDEGDDLEASVPSRQLVWDGSGYQTVPLSYAGETGIAAWAQRDLARAQGGRQAVLAGPQEELEIAALTMAHPQYFDTLELARKLPTHTSIESDSRDKDQPAKGGDVHREVERYLRMRAAEFGGEARGASSGQFSYAPKSLAQKAREEARARRGPHGRHTNTADGNPWADTQGGPLSGPARGARGRTLMPS